MKKTRLAIAVPGGSKGTLAVSDYRRDSLNGQDGNGGPDKRSREDAVDPRVRADPIGDVGNSGTASAIRRVRVTDPEGKEWPARLIKSYESNAEVEIETPNGIRHRVVPLPFVRNLDGSGLGKKEPEILCLADVEPIELNWLWTGRIPLGTITTVAGDPGVGKSFMMIELCARVSTGRPWPDQLDGPNQVGSAVLFSAEDDLERTVVPRLAAAGADLTRLFTMPKFQSVDDIERLEKLLVSVGDTRLVAIDPIGAYTGEIDDHRNNAVRALLVPWAKLAATHQIAIVLVTHLSKGQSEKALKRIMGSVAYTAAARSVWMVVKDPEDNDRRLFLPVKCNLAPEPKGLAYSVEGEPGRVVWDRTPLDIHADDILAFKKPPGRPSERQRAADWMKSYLADGPKPSEQVVEDGNKALAINRNLKWWRESVFKKKIGGTPCHAPEFRGGWIWELPTQESQGTQESQDDCPEISCLRWGCDDVSQESG
jgi:putative DNA primase/helicase